MNIPADNKFSFSPTESVATDDSPTDTGGKNHRVLHDHCYLKSSSGCDSTGNIDKPIRGRRLVVVSPDEKKRKTEARRIKNIESSKVSRDREKKDSADLKRNIENIVNMNQQLSSENNTLREKMVELEEQNRSLSGKLRLAANPEETNLVSALIPEPNPVGLGLGYDAEKLEQEAFAWDTGSHLNVRLFEDIDPDEPEVSAGSRQPDSINQNAR